MWGTASTGTIHPDSKPRPFPSIQLPPRGANCQVESQPDIWGMCQTTTEPVSPFIKCGGGSCWSPWREGQLSLQRPPHGELQPPPSRFAFGFILGLTWLQGLRFYFSAVRRYCCFFPLENINTTFTKWCIALFQIILHLLINPHDDPMKCLCVLSSPYYRREN